MCQTQPTTCPSCRHCVDPRYISYCESHNHKYAMCSQLGDRKELCQCPACAASEWARDGGESQRVVGASTRSKQEQELSCDPAHQREGVDAVTQEDLMEFLEQVDEELRADINEEELSEEEVEALRARQEELWLLKIQASAHLQLLEEEEEEEEEDEEEEEKRENERRG